MPANTPAVGGKVASGVGIILCVGAHPDDIEIGCGGTIRVFVRLGFRVVCVFLTHGERGGDPAVRERESREACRWLGVLEKDIHFGHFPDTDVQASHETIAFLEQFVSDQLWGVFIPSANEWHQDHRNVALACWAAFRHVQRILAYESPSVTPQFRPNAFVRINGHLRAKWRALKCHRSQILQGRMYLQYRSIVHLAAFRGQQNGVDYAEAFEAIRLRIDPEFVPPIHRERPRSIGTRVKPAYATTTSELTLDGRGMPPAGRLTPSDRAARSGARRARENRAVRGGVSVRVG